MARMSWEERTIFYISFVNSAVFFILAASLWVKYYEEVWCNVIMALLAISMFAGILFSMFRNWCWVKDSIIDFDE